MRETLRRFGSKGVPYVVFLSFVTYQASWLSSAAMRNWDGLGYAGCAAALETSDSEVVHHRVFESARAVVDSRTWRDLTTGDAYRSTVFRSPQVFRAQLPLYRDRVLYSLMTYAVHRLGVELFAASAWVSLASYFATCALILVWLRRRIDGWAAAMVTTAVAQLPFMVVPARLSTPDMLCTFLVAAALFSLLEQRALWGFAGFALAAVCARSDSILFFVVLALWMHLRAPPGFERRKLLAISGVLISAYAGITVWSDRPGWWTVFYFTFVHRNAYWGSSPVSFDLEIYWETVKQLWRPQEGYYGYAVAACGLAAVGLRGTRRGEEDVPRVVALGALLVTCVVRYVFVPRFFDWDRLYAPYFLAILILSALGVSGGTYGSRDRRPPLSMSE